MKTKAAFKEIIFNLLERTAVSCSKDIDKGKIKKILIFEGGGIGDLLMLFPAIIAIKEQFPDSSISFLVSPYAKDVLKSSSCSENITEIIEYDSKGTHLSFFKKLSLIKYIRGKVYDLIYAPSRGEGMREVILMVYLMGASYRIGFTKGKIGLLNTNSVEFNDNDSILHQNLQLLRKVGVTVNDETIKINIQEQNRVFAQKLINKKRNDFTGPLVSIHVSAHWMANYKSWSSKKYIELIKYLIESHNATIVLVGSKNERTIGEEIIKQVKRDHLINTMGMTTISQMISIIQTTDMFIGGDSGPLHISLALNIPSVGIFGPTSPEHILSSSSGNCSIVRKDLPCSPCYTHQYSFRPSCVNAECLSMISVEDVRNAAEKILMSFTNKSALN